MWCVRARYKELTKFKLLALSKLRTQLEALAHHSKANEQKQAPELVY